MHAIQKDQPKAGDGKNGKKTMKIVGVFPWLITDQYIAQNRPKAVSVWLVFSSSIFDIGNRECRVAKGGVLEGADMPFL